MDEQRRANRALWNELTAINARSPLYRLDQFKAGEIKLNPLERGEVGDVRGKKLLHLQCHFGMDTLSWARLGAEVTGVDFSEEAIEMARGLSEELGIPARFICSDIYELEHILDEDFDIVFTSYGVLTWLSDLPRWAALAASFVRPGGFFYMAEFHPFAMVFDDESSELRLRYPYFLDEALALPVNGAYSDREAHLDTPVAYEWQHTLGDIITHLVSSGLRIEYLHEFPYTVYQQLPMLEQRDEHYWGQPDGRHDLPLVFSLKAGKPEAGKA